MIDVTTNKPMKVRTAREAGPSLMLPVSQVEAVRSLLDQAGVEYWVDSIEISLNGQPATTVINMYRKTNAAAVQELLDQAS